MDDFINTVHVVYFWFYFTTRPTFSTVETVSLFSENPMLLDGIHDVSDDPYESIVHHFPTSEELHGKTLDVTSEEEAALDADDGMMWPMYFAEEIAKKYRQRGEDIEGIGIELTCLNDNNFRVTFSVERNSSPH